MTHLLTPAERLERARGIRRYALKLLGYYLLIAAVACPVGLVRWLGDKAEDFLSWLDLPAYRMRSAQEELRRELVRDNRRRARAENPDVELP